MVDNPPANTGKRRLINDINSCFYLHPSDYTGFSVCPAMLKGEENFQEWLTAIYKVSQAKGKMGFLEGRIPEPTGPNDLEDWTTVNSILIRWIIQSIDPTLHSSITYNGGSVYELLLELHQRFSRLHLSETLFKEGISLLLSKWSALQFAIQEESGGRNTRAKALKLESDLFNWFTKTTKGDVDLDDLLYDAMLQTLNVVVDDGSIEEVADKLSAMHEECFVGNYETVERLRESASRAKPVQHVKQMESDDDDGGDSDSDMMSDDEEDSDDGDDDVDMMVDVPEIKSNQAPVQEVINRQPNSSNAAAPAEDDGWEVVTSKKNKGRRN